MVDRKVIVTAAVFLIGTGILSGLFGVSGLIASVLVGVASVAGLRYFNLIGSSMLYPLNQSASLWVMLLAISGTLFLTPGLAGQATDMFQPSTATLGQPTQPSQPQTQVSQAGCSVPSELADDSITVSLDASDAEADTATTVTVPAAVHKNDGTRIKDISSFDTGQTFNVAAGTQVVIAGGNSSGGSSAYYLEQDSVCIDEPSETVTLTAHAMMSEGSGSITVYDNTGSSELTTKTEADYTVGDLATDEEDQVFVEFKNSGADTAYNFAGYAVNEFNDVDQVDPVTGFSDETTPRWLEDVDIAMNETVGAGTPTINGDYSVYRAPSATLLHNFDTVKHQFNVQTDPNSNPAGNEGTTGFDGFAVVTLDQAGAEAADGTVSYDIATDDSNENNVGVIEDKSQPTGLTTGSLVMVE